MKFNTDLFANTRILVVGDIMLDCYQWGKVERISPEAPVPIVHVQKKTHMLGGAGNVALNLSSLGCHTDILAASGIDRPGKHISSLLKKNKIGFHLFSDKNCRTITKTRIMAQDQQLIRIDEEEITPLNLSQKTILLDKLKKELHRYDAVILSDYGKGLFQTRGLIEQVILLCRENKKYVLVDPKGNDWKKYRNATCITPNTAELELVAGGKTANDTEILNTSTAICRAYDLDWLLVTLGSRGMCVTGRETPPFILPTEAREVYDVSGAGDTVIAVLAAGLSTGLSFIDSAEMANRAAGIVVGKIGTQPVTKEELHSVLSAMPSPSFPDLAQ